MSDNKESADAQVLHWPGKLFSADDLHRHWKNQRELVLLPRTLLTPLALDELHAKGVRITRQERAASGQRQSSGTSSAAQWAYVQEQPDSLITAAVAALEREGRKFTALDPAGLVSAAWFRSLEGWVSQNAGSVLFCRDAAFTCCLANKVAGLRAAALAKGSQAGRAVAKLGANVLVVEMPGPTFFEVRQILCTAAGMPVCPPETADLIVELEGHAHR